MTRLQRSSHTRLAAGCAVLTLLVSTALLGPTTRLAARPSCAYVAGHPVQTLEAAASQAHLELALVKAVAWRESRWTDRRGAAGEYGVLQVMPGTAQLVNQKLIGCSLDPAVPGNSLRQGTVLLRYLLDRAGNQVAPALAAYHSGYSQMDARNRPYVTAVLRYRDWFMHHPRADRAAAARYLG